MNKKWEIWFRTKLHIPSLLPDSHDWKLYWELEPLNEKTIDKYVDNLNKSGLASWLEFEKRGVMK